jgi:3'-phosphoadenosine 5'-phosphosulfate sulfotransferase (PAPS reductase)/FAD synthetase
MKLPVINDESCSRSGDFGVVMESAYPHCDKAILDAVRARIDQKDTKVLVGLSGGKDSVSVCLLLMELGIPFECVMADTKWESKLTYRYVDWFCYQNNIKLTIVSSGKHDGLIELIKHKGCFPKMKRRFCTEELKEMPISAHIASLKAEGHDVISVAGIRASESKQRAKMAEWVEHDDRFGCSVWHPIFSWSYEDTIAMHYRHGCKPNPLYLLGAERVGCFPCVFEKKAGLRIVSMIDPGRIDILRGTESYIDKNVRERRGDSYEERNYPTSTMFWMSINGQCRPALIDDVIQRSWKPADAKERVLIEGGLASQAEAAQRRWGWSMAVDGLDSSFKESELAIHANYEHRYLTTKELKANGNVHDGGLHADASGR